MFFHVHLAAVIFICVITYKDLYALCSFPDERLQRINIVRKSKESKGAVAKGGLKFWRTVKKKKK